MNMTYSECGVILTEHDEGTKLYPYQDQGGTWTVGTGHTGDDFVHDASVPITQEQADAFLQADMQTAIDGVNAAVTADISQHHFDACVDLAFNIGVHAFANSTVCRELNAGNIEGAYRAIAMWNKVGGVVNKGLIKRRADEQELFEREDCHGL